MAFNSSTPLSVCHNKRIGRHRVFAEVARRGKSSMGWFYGLKLQSFSKTSSARVSALSLRPSLNQLKNISQIEHTWHRSTTNFIVSLIAGLIAYTWQAKKSSLHLCDKDMALLPALV